MLDGSLCINWWIKFGVKFRRTSAHATGLQLPILTKFFPRMDKQDETGLTG